MASKSYFPSKDTELLAWATNFSTLITAAPTDYGLVAGDATAFALVKTNFATAMAANEKGVRSKATVAAKNDARTAMKNAAKFLVRRIQGTPTVTDAQKYELGITVRSAPQPIPAPAFAPAVDIKKVDGRLVTLHLHDAEHPSRRAKPDGVHSAVIFSYVGPTPPSDPRLYKWEGSTSETTVDVLFPESVEPGSVVYLTAMWQNERQETGPACPAVQAVIQYGMTASA